MPVPLVALKLGKDKADEIVGYLTEKFQKAVESRSSQIDGKYRRWMDNYAAKPREAIRTAPFFKASNFVPQLIRMHTDIMSASLTGMIFGTKPIWRPKSLVGAIPQRTLNDLSTWMEEMCSYHINFFPAIDQTIFRTVKAGFTVLKSPWVDNTRWMMKDGKLVEVNHEGLKLAPVPFDDFYCFPVTVQDLSLTQIRFMRLRMTKEEVEFRINTKLWEEGPAKKLLDSESRESGTAREGQASDAGISLTPDVSRPYTAIEAWFDYELEPGKMVPLCVTFNPINKLDGYLRGFYNYYSTIGMDPYTDFCMFPREDLICGYSMPEILEQSQEEQAQIHNSRRDANSIANVPTFKKKRLADVANPATEWYPGKVFEVDAMDDLEAMEFGASYNSLVEEENMTMQLAERYSGVSPPQQGYGAGTQGKRGVYANSATLALLSEGNRRSDIYLKRLRMPFHRLGATIFQSYRDFRPKGEEYQVWGDVGTSLLKLFSYKEPKGFDGAFFNLGASDAGANKETDRTSLLLMSNTLGAYYKELVQLTQMAVSAPPGSPAGEMALKILDGAKNLVDRLLFVFDVGDGKVLVPDAREILSGNSKPNGGGRENSGSAVEGSLPPAEGNVSPEDMAGLSDRIAQIQSARGQGALESGNGFDGR